MIKRSLSSFLLPLILLSSVAAFPQDRGDAASLEPPDAGHALAGVIPETRSEDPRDCISPRERADIERQIREYEAAKGGAVASPGGPAPYPFVPQAGRVWQDLYVTNFADLDPSGGIRDWDCSNFTYDGHRGHDIAIRSFKEQAIGVPIFAALDGTVVGAHDGEPDMNTVQMDVPANYVILDHGGSHQTLYWHMKRGSVAVTQGQFVKAGTQLGLTASSGFSNGPHLHFESHFNNAWYEPSAGACRSGPSYWVSQIPIRRTLYAIDFNFSPVPFADGAFTLFDETTRVGSFPTGARTIYFRAVLRNLPAFSSYRARVVRPNGAIAADFSGNFNNPQLYRYAQPTWYANLNLDTVGPWKVVLDFNGQQLLEAPFQVVPGPSDVVNQAPSLQGLGFSPAAPGTDDVIFCEVTNSPDASDPNYDIVSYRYVWKVNGTVVRTVTSAARSDALAKNMAPPGATVECTVTPTDGVLFGTGGSISLRVAGSASIACGETLGGSWASSDSLSPIRDGCYADGYATELSAGQEVTISLSSPNNFDTYLYLLGPNGSVVDESDDVDDSNRNSRIEYTVPSSGTYTLHCTTYGEQATADYTIALMCSAPPEPPAAPSNLSASDITATGCQLNWTDNSNDETNFAADFWNGSAWQQFHEPPANSTSMGVGGLQANATYRFRVRAVNQYGSSPSNEISVTTVTPPDVTSMQYVAKAGKPVKVKIFGSNFQPGAQVFVGGSSSPWPSVKFKSSTLFVLKGDSLTSAFPVGVDVQVRFVNPNGGADTYTFRR
jgi:murein DD-endopeptidase MepM/ murein hydrolase activator NlpD